MNQSFWKLVFLFIFSVFAVLFDNFFPVHANEITKTGLTAHTPTTSPEYAEAELQEMADRLNARRLELGLKPLEKSEKLDEIAENIVTEQSQNLPLEAYSSDELQDDMCKVVILSDTPDSNQNAHSINDPISTCTKNGSYAHSGYAITKVLVASGVPVKKYIVVALYSQSK